MNSQMRCMSVNVNEKKIEQKQRDLINSTARH